MTPLVMLAIERSRRIVAVIIAITFGCSVGIAGDGSGNQQIPSQNGWLMTASTLVLFMTAPGLALFYAGLVRKKNVLSVFMQCTCLVSVMSIVWCIYGYSLAFSNGGKLNGLIGGNEYFWLSGVQRTWDEATQSPQTPMWIRDGIEQPVTKLSHVLFQGMFFIIAPAIMCGSFAERIKFNGLMVFSILWGTFVYCPIAHWVWGGGWLSYPTGWLGGGIDFAGGTVVHICSGVSALIASMVVGPRLGFGRDPMPPHNLTYTAIGASMLWVGWFGFNAGNALVADEIASSAMLTTHLGAAAGAIGWLLVEWRLRSKPTVLGVSSGVVAGLVCITPAAGFVQPMSAIVIGAAGGIASYFGCSLCKHWGNYDDALDAFGIHGVGGIVGALLTGLFASRTCYNIGGAAKLGWLEGGNVLYAQIALIVVTVAYSAIASWILLKIVDWTMGLRVSANDERQGLDVNQHGEEGYIFL